MSMKIVKYGFYCQLVKKFVSVEIVPRVHINEIQSQASKLQ